MKFINSVNPTNKEAVNLVRSNSIQIGINDCHASITFYYGETNLTRWDYGKEDLQRFEQDVANVCNTIQCHLQVPDYSIYEDACKKV